MRALRDAIFFCLESSGKSGGPDADRPSASPACAAPHRPFAAAADRAGAPLASLAGGALAGRLRGFRGASGRRYVTTAFDLTDPAWLDIDGAVLLVAARGGAGRIVAAHAGPDEAARRRLLATLLAGEGSGVEIHLHLLAEGPVARQAAALDLIGGPH